ncbi:XRE family transcriptional regulator [Solitalea longa]|uniref:XRE family transcriptional regulator n=1 Tax=Solitalea longa TaxID=2079460 RepID=A0A2S5A922_9SPHI|nr:helix-turn-helix transcriptional regulator [Solitalea longa]POY39078.1 XRE family transcriptional regulator [Solitalea longa]
MLNTDFDYLETTDAKFRLRIALEIKRAREVKRLSQKDFYQLTGINIARVETGKQHLSVKTLRTICYTLDISMGGLFNCIRI